VNDVTPQGRDTVVAGVAAVVVGGGTLGVYLLVNSRQPVPTWVRPDVLVTALSLNLAGCATIAVRRRWPWVAVTAGTALVLTSSALALATTGPAIGLVVGAYTVAMSYPLGRSLPLLAILAATHAVGGIALSAAGGGVRGLPTYWGVPGDDRAAMVFAAAGSYGIPLAVGAMVRRRRAHTAALTVRAERLEAEREARDRAAAAEERRRIARELHDIAAHDLSAIVVQAGAADRLVDRDATAVRAILREIRGQGRDTLTALRHLVGILREDDAGGRAPQPGLAQMGDLLAVARAAGTRVTLSITGEPRPLPALVDLALYRVLQEALTNARRHAPDAPVAVSVRYEAEAIRLVVRNAQARTVDATRSGHGLAGMRERIRHAGGTLMAGPTGDGDWSIDARLPT